MSCLISNHCRGTYLLLFMVQIQTLPYKPAQMKRILLEYDRFKYYCNGLGFSPQFLIFQGTMLEKSKADLHILNFCSCLCYAVDPLDFMIYLSNCIVIRLLIFCPVFTNLFKIILLCYSTHVHINVFPSIHSLLHTNGILDLQCSSCFTSMPKLHFCEAITQDLNQPICPYLGKGLELR